LLNYGYHEAVYELNTRFNICCDAGPLLESMWFRNLTFKENNLDMKDLYASIARKRFPHKNIATTPKIPFITHKVWGTNPHKPREI